MSRLLLPFLFFAAAGCTASRQQTATAEAQILRSYSMHIYKTTRNNITLTVMDKALGEALPFASIVVRDSINTIKYTGKTDINGQWQIPALPDSIYNMKISWPGFTSLLIVNMNPQAGDSIAVKLEQQLNDTLEYRGCRFDDPPLNDPFSPQNKTIQRDEIRRMPK